MSINHAAIKSSHIYLLIIKICRHIETAVLAVRNVTCMYEPVHMVVQ